jgi:hypothetical protein
VGVVQWQHTSFPSWERGSESRHPLGVAVVNSRGCEARYQFAHNASSYQVVLVQTGLQCDVSVSGQHGTLPRCQGRFKSGTSLAGESK